MAARYQALSTFQEGDRIKFPTQGDRCGHQNPYPSLLRRGSQWGFRCKNPLGKVGAGAKERDPLSGGCA